MNVTNLFKIAFRAIAANKLRSFLGQGSKKSIQSQIAEMGSNMIMIQPGADMRGGVRQDA